MTGSAISLETTVIVTHGLHERRVGDKVFVLDTESVMHAMDNDVSVAIWDALREAPASGLSVRAVVQMIVSDFEVSLERASRDVLDFARLLHARGILVPSD